MDRSRTLRPVEHPGQLDLKTTYAIEHDLSRRCEVLYLEKLVGDCRRKTDARLLLAAYGDGVVTLAEDLYLLADDPATGRPLVDPAHLDLG
jgi:hypothetical protein